MLRKPIAAAGIVLAATIGYAGAADLPVEKAPALKPVPIAPTLADGVSGNIERGSVTWSLARKLVDSVVLVEEEGIEEAMRWAIDEQRLLLEASAVLGISVLLKRRDATLRGRRVAVVCTGRNVDGETIRRVLAGA